MAKTMADVLAKHTPVDATTDGVPEDEIWCNSIECGFKMKRTNDYDETLDFAAHQAAALSAAGFGLVADAKREAWADAWDEGHERGFWNGRLSQLTIPYDAPDPLIGKQDAEANNPYRKASK